jgi:hypothetical protein
MSELFWSSGKPFIYLNGDGEHQYWSKGLPFPGLIDGAIEPPVTPTISPSFWINGIPFSGLEGGETFANEDYWFGGRPGIALIPEYFVIDKSDINHFVDNLDITRIVIFEISNSNISHKSDNITLIIGLSPGQRWRNGKGIVDGAIYSYLSDV